MQTHHTLLAKLLAQDLGIDKIASPVHGGSDYSTGLVGFINNGFKLIFLGFGLYALLNFVLAAYNMINAQGEQKNIDKAKKMITNSIIALLLLSMVFVFGGVVGQVFFGNWNFILDPVTTINTISP